jgi:hypothetical protein
LDFVTLIVRNDIGMSGRCPKAGKAVDRAKHFFFASRFQPYRTCGNLLQQNAGLKITGNPLQKI